MMLDTRPLRIPAFRRMWVSTIATAVGSQLTSVSVPLQVYAVTGSSAYVGLSGVFALAPLMVFGLWGGAIADAVDRRTLMIATNAGIAVTSLLLWVQAAVGNESVWVIFGLLAAQQALFGMNRPARQAAVPRLVPASKLPAANALTGTVGTFGMVAGPLFAGAMIPIIGLSTMYLLDTIGLVLAIVAVWRLPALPPLSENPSKAGLRDVVDGLRYLATRKVLLISLVADVIAMIFGMPRALFPEIADDTFGGTGHGGVAIGLLYSSVAIGSVLAGLFSGLFTRTRRHGVVITVGVCCWGLAMAGFGLVHVLWLAVLFLALGGACDMISMVMRATIMQNEATDELRGRAQGVFTVVVAGGPRLADLMHGTVGAVAGTTFAVSGGGLLVVVVMLALAVAVPVFWRYRAPQPDS